MGAFQLRHDAEAGEGEDDDGRCIMNSPTNPRSLNATIIVALIVAAGIALANLSSEPVTGDLITRIANKPERAYGWPLTWYWRTAVAVPTGMLNWSGAPRPAVQWPVARYSASRLMTNLAIWLTLVAGTAAAYQRLLGRCASRRNCRPRMTTLVPLLSVVAPTVLANTTFEMSWSSPFANGPGATAMASFGWPLVWNWYVIAPFDNVYGWDFSALRIAGNIAIWLGMVVLATLLWEWLLRRPLPRLRFSLRTMLAGTSLIAILCAWCVGIWKRADEQDALAAAIGNVGIVWVERSGPKWLGVMVPDRLRRCVVGVSICVGRPSRPDEMKEGKDSASDDERTHHREAREIDSNEQGSHPEGEIRDANEDENNEDVLGRLARLRALRFLKIECETLTPAMADAMGEIKQLRMLHLGIEPVRPDRRANIGWLTRLPELHQLSLRGVSSDDLGCVVGLTRLKSLTLDFSDCHGDDLETEKRLTAVRNLQQLRRVRLEGFPASQVARLRGVANVKSLTLDFDPVADGPLNDDPHRIHDCFFALGDLAQLEQLELDLGGDLWVRPEDLSCLRGLKNLQSLKLQIPWTDESESQACLAAIARLTHLRRLWLEGELVSGDLSELSALEALEELTSDRSIATAAALESLSALKHLKAIHITGLNLFLHSKTAEIRGVGRALEGLHRSRPEIIVDANSHSRWMEAQQEDFPWSRYEHFHPRKADLEWFLGYSQ
jgi:hypothetical protein